MTVKDQLNEALKNAMKDHDEEKKLTYRMALAAIKFAEKEGQKEVSDEEALELVQREIKAFKKRFACPVFHIYMYFNHIRAVFPCDTGKNRIEIGRAHV